MWVLVFAALVVAGALGLARYSSARRESARRAGARSELALPALDPRERHLVLLMLDGLPVQPFEAALEARELPNLERLFARGPVLRTRAVSTFPSATAPSLPELLSGRWAELEDMPAPNAVHAFDREERRIVRYLTEPDTWEWPVANLFDATTRAGLSAVTVFEGRWQGPESILTTAAIARAAALEVVGAGQAGGDRGPVEALCQRIREKGAPRVAFVVFNEVDLKGHFHGPESPELRHALVATDALIGRIASALEEARTPSGRPVLEETAFVLFGDHGMAPSGRFFDLVDYFAERGLTAYDASTITHVVFRERLGIAWTRWPDAILVSGGSNITQVYLRSSLGGWGGGSDDDAAPREVERAQHRPDVESVARDLAEQPGVGQVLRLLARGEVELRAAGDSVARVIERGQGKERRWAYVVPAGATTDPLGYLGDSAVASLLSREGADRAPTFHDVDTWFERARDARYPAAVPLIPKAFHMERFTGDLMVTARPGWSFLRNQHGDHGNLEREAMLTPLVLFGAGIASDATLPLARLVDIYPTVAVLLGADPADRALVDLDGRVLPGVRAPGAR